MPDCGVHYLWFAFVCFLIRSHPPVESNALVREPAGVVSVKFWDFSDAFGSGLGGATA